MSLPNEKTNEEQKPVAKNKKTVNIIVDVVLALAIVIEIFAAYTAFVSKTGNGVPGIFGIKAFAIQSDSMEPTFSKGDLIIDVSVKDVTALEVGDVITFNTIINGQYTKNTHRIVQINHYGDILTYTTKGDNSPANDYLEVNANEVIGKYSFRIIGVGSVIDFLQTSTGFLLVIVLPIVAFFIFQIAQFFKALFAYQAEKVRLQYQADMDAKKEDKGN